MAGLRTAKQALVEAVVLPTLRSDIFQVQLELDLSWDLVLGLIPAEWMVVPWDLLGSTFDLTTNRV